jgi:hypothetical protein
MPWAEAQVDELIENGRRDFALGRFFLTSHKNCASMALQVKKLKKQLASTASSVSMKRMA